MSNFDRDFGQVERLADTGRFRANLENLRQICAHDHAVVRVPLGPCEHYWTTSAVVWNVSTAEFLHMEAERIDEILDITLTLGIVALVVPRDGERLLEREELDLGLRENIEFLVAPGVEPHIDEVFLALELCVGGGHQLALLNVVD